MPYIPQNKRSEVATRFRGPEVAGELNFRITREIINYLKRNGISYQTINDIRGAVIGAQLEFERRIANPYEDLKIKENGDVYPEQLLEAVKGDAESN